MRFVLARSSTNKIPEAAGVYVISCRYSRSVYIGSTFNFRDRFGKHLSKLIRKKHPNKNLQRLFEKQQVIYFAPVKVCELVELMRVEKQVLDSVRGKCVLNIDTKIKYYRRRK